MTTVYEDYTVNPGDHLELAHVHHSLEDIVGSDGDGWLTITAGAVFDAPNLTHVYGRLTINERTVVDVPRLSVVGDLQIVGAKTILPALARVRGTVSVLPDSVLDAPALLSINEQLHVWPGAVVRAPLLTHARLYVEPGGEFIGLRGVRARPGETWSRFRRRVLFAAATFPHERCATKQICIEHAFDKTVPSCKRKGRVT